MSKLLRVGDFDVQHTVTLTLAVILQPSPYFEKSWMRTVIVAEIILQHEFLCVV